MGRGRASARNKFLFLGRSAAIGCFSAALTERRGGCYKIRFEASARRPLCALAGLGVRRLPTCRSGRGTGSDSTEI